MDTKDFLPGDPVRLSFDGSWVYGLVAEGKNWAELISTEDPESAKCFRQEDSSKIVPVFLLGSFVGQRIQVLENGRKGLIPFIQRFTYFSSNGGFERIRGLDRLFEYLRELSIFFPFNNYVCRAHTELIVARALLREKDNNYKNSFLYEILKKAFPTMID